MKNCKEIDDGGGLLGSLNIHHQQQSLSLVKHVTAPITYRRILKNKFKSNSHLWFNTPAYGKMCGFFKINTAAFLVSVRLILGLLWITN